VRAASKTEYNHVPGYWGVYPSKAGPHEVRVMPHGTYTLYCQTEGAGNVHRLRYIVLYISRRFDLPQIVGWEGMNLTEARQEIRLHDAMKILKDES
jgi:hypothetical protein